MNEIKIENSFQLEFIAHYSMHLERLYLEITGGKDTKQRDRYTQLIEFINQAPFDSAFEKYKQIALADTNIHLLSESMLSQAKRLAYLDLNLPWPEQADW